MDIQRSDGETNFSPGTENMDNSCGCQATDLILEPLERETMDIQRSDGETNFSHGQFLWTINTDTEKFHSLNYLT